MKVSVRLFIDALHYAISHSKVHNAVGPLDAYSVFSANSLNISLKEVKDSTYTVRIFFDFVSMTSETDKDAEIIVKWSYPQGFQLVEVNIISHT